MTDSAQIGLRKWPVAVLGATGAVGQTFVRLLENHPWFQVAEVAASERSAGRKYGEVTRWIEGTMPESVRDMDVVIVDPASIRSPIVFSAMDSSVAGAFEEAFAKAGRFVLSNAKNHRMEPDIPLVIPEVNPSQLSIIPRQQQVRGWTGAIITNANCAATVAAMALAPLHEKYRISKLFIATMQAVSGAGYPGVASLDILGNVVPHIADEEPKLEREMCKLLGGFANGEITLSEMQVSSHTNRVPVEHGHTVCMSVEFDVDPGVNAAIDTLRKWNGAKESRGLPSSPERPLIYMDAVDRPQPRRDVNTGNGMTVSVGRVRTDPLFHLRLVATGHNTIRGAAGGSVLNAELLASKGVIPPA
ncbi:MAG: aspartate-semialdehyde dehydrogenase [Gemmatimonadaceae bacterium]|nr:aspartate-semialdehyde dehydrogenase [Gemmatimonadaceae bacterium]